MRCPVCKSTMPVWSASREWGYTGGSGRKYCSWACLRKKEKGINSPNAERNIQNGIEEEKKREERENEPQVKVMTNKEKSVQMLTEFLRILPECEDWKQAAIRVGYRINKKSAAVTKHGIRIALEKNKMEVPDCMKVENPQKSHKKQKGEQDMSEELKQKEIHEAEPEKQMETGENTPRMPKSLNVRELEGGLFYYKRINDGSLAIIPKNGKVAEVSAAEQIDDMIRELQYMKHVMEGRI